LGAVGPLDIEIFKVNGEYYVGEINARIGGSYFLGYACGVDFASLIINNVNGLENTVNIGNYESGVLMLRYDKMLTIREGKRLQ
jgi:carbamoyl-phosphate synthase large subunit